MVVSPAKGTFHRRRARRPTSAVLAPGTPIGDVASLARPHQRRGRPRRPGRRVARRGRRPRLPRPAAAPPPPGGGSLMAAHRLGAPARRTPRSSDSAPTAPPAMVPNSEVVEAIESSDEWIQQRSGIKQRRWAAPDETDPGDVGRRRPARPSSGPASRRSRSTASSSPPSPTCCRPRRSPPRSPTSSAPTTPPPSTSPPPAPASATASRWPPTWSAAAAPATCW